MSFPLDITYALSEKIGPQGGVSRDSLMALVGDFLDVHNQFDSAKNTGVLPHLTPFESKKEDIKIFRSLCNSFEGSIIFVGDRGNLAALQAHLVQPNKYTWLEDVSPENLNALFAEDTEILLFVLDGPPWVRALAETLISSVSRMIICVGDGSAYDGWQIEGAELIHSPAVSDVRFAPFSALGLALLLEDGVSYEELEQSYNNAQERGSLEGMLDNPSFLLASIFAALEKERNPLRPVLMFPNATWFSWARWASTVWMGITSQVLEKDGVRRRFGSEATYASVCDEAVMQQLLSSPREQITLLFSSQKPKLAEPSPLTSRAWNVQNNLLDAFADLMARESRPVCEISLQDATSLSLFEASFFWVHSAIALAGFWVEDPLLLEGADRYRRKLSNMLKASS